MTLLIKSLAAGAGFAALAAATPATAQIPYGYGYGYGYNYNYNSSQMAAQRCAAAVQNRLSTRVGLSGILGAVFGNNTAQGRVLSITRVDPRRNTVRVRGLASSGTSYGYGPYGVGAYGAVGYAYRPDLSFSCSVDYRGYIRDVDINRR